MDEELKTEVEEILENARAAYRAGEITLEQMQDAIRIPLMDLYTENWSPKTLDRTRRWVYNLVKIKKGK